MSEEAPFRALCNRARCAGVVREGEHARRLGDAGGGAAAADAAELVHEHGAGGRFGRRKRVVVAARARRGVIDDSLRQQLEGAQQQLRLARRVLAGVHVRVHQLQLRERGSCVSSHGRRR